MKKSIYIITSIAVLAFVLVTFLWFLPSLKNEGEDIGKPKSGTTIEGDSGKIAQKDPTQGPSGYTATPTPPDAPTDTPTLVPSDTPTIAPTDGPSDTPSPTGSVAETTPSQPPTLEPTKPQEKPTTGPTSGPEKPTSKPTTAPDSPTPKQNTPTPPKPATNTPTPSPIPKPTNTPVPTVTDTPTPSPSPIPSLTPTPLPDLGSLQVGVHSSQYSSTYNPFSFQGTGEYYGFVNVAGRYPEDGAIYKMDKSVAVSKAKEMLMQMFYADGNDVGSKFFVGKGVTLGSQPFYITGGKKTTFGAYVSGVKGLYQSQYIASEIKVIADTNCVYFEKANIADMEILVPVVRCRIIYDVRINNAGSLYSTSGLFQGIGVGEDRYYQFVDVCPVCMTDSSGAFGSGIVALTAPKLFR